MNDSNDSKNVVLRNREEKRRASAVMRRERRIVGALKRLAIVHGGLRQSVLEIARARFGLRSIAHVLEVVDRHKDAHDLRTKWTTACKRLAAEAA